MNPVLQKDLLGLLRLKRVAAVQVVFVGILAVCVLISWPQEGVISAHGALGAGGDRLLLGLTIGQIVLLMLFIPGIAAGAVSGEREQNTLEMLYASRLSARQIIAGKIGVVTAYPILLLVMALPFLAILNWRGDARGSDLFWAYSIILIAAMFVAVVSVAISAYCKQTATALVLSYSLILLLGGAVLVPAAIALDNADGLTASVLHYARALSPVAAALSLLQPGSNFTGLSRGLLPIWQIFLPAALLVIACCLVALVLKLRRAPHSSDGYGGVGIQEAERSTLRKILFLIDPKKRPKPFGSWNWLVSKERRTGSLRSGRWIIRIFYVCLVLSLALAAMSLYSGVEQGDLLRYVAQVVVALQVGIVALISPSLTSGAVSGELENGTWELLRLTPRGGGGVFIGKLLPSLLPAIIPVLALLPAYAALCMVNTAYVFYFARVLPVVFLAVLFCCMVGLTCSCFIANTARATVTACLIVACIFVLPLFAYLAAGEQLSERIAPYLAYPSALVVALNELPGSWEPVHDLYALHLWTIAAACAGMLLISWIRLNLLLRRGE